MLIPRGEGSCALEVMSVQTRRCFFLFRTISSREARPVISAMINTPFLIDCNKSVQLGGSLRAQALKFPFFLVPFSFGNERKRNSARRADTARLRAIAKERYSRHAPSEHTRCYVSKSCYCDTPMLRMGRTGIFCRRQNFSHITCDVTHSSRLRRATFPSQHLTFGSSCTVIFDQVRKALVRSTLYRCNLGGRSSSTPTSRSSSLFVQFYRAKRDP